MMTARFFSFLACILATVSFSAIANEQNDGQKETGFVSLFNGKNLDGWQIVGDKAGFQVKDGVIHSDARTGGEWLRSEKSYKNYILKVDWKVSKGGNSGVFIRATKEGNPWVTGYEIQISNPKQDKSHCTGSLYSYVPVIKRPDESAEKWHTFEIHCQGSNIKVISDNVTCIDFDQSTNEKTKEKPLEGFIGLQDAHAAKGNDIEYRNIRIKVLD